MNPDSGSTADSGVSPTQVREELERILASRDFQSSRLCQNFLRYVVENTLAGHPENLKERNIGVEVFGKPVSYDPSEDAGVRVKAGEIRKRLRSFYQTHAADAPVVIELPPGTYIPEFRSPQEKPAPLPPPSAGRRPGLLVLAGLLLLALAVTAYYWLRPHPAPESLREFWSPVFQSGKPVFVCTAAVPVYSDAHNQESKPPSRVEDFVLVPNRFVAVSDVNSAIQVADMFGRLGEPYKLRIGNDVSFRDLLAAPAVLVGFSYTNWHEIGEHFRYTIDLSKRPFGVSQDGVATQWTIKNHPDDPELAEDYAIVSRVMYPGTNNMIVEITGISHYGTEAAADLVTNPTLLADVLRKMPAGWQQKNIQLVLHTEVVSGYPSIPTVVAIHVWK